MSQFEEFKERQSVVWGSAPFENVQDTIADVHETVVDRLEPQEGESWLDIGSGTGNLAEIAARSGARVTGVDLAPVLVETAKRFAQEKGLEIEYRVGDAERLEGIDDGSFDVVSSTFGTMFAPDHPATAGELARVTRAGGRIGLANWRPDGGIGKMFKMLAEFQPPPPEGAGSPLDWGREEYVEQLLGDDFELSFAEEASTWRAESAEDIWELMVSSFGPMKTLADSLGDRREELHQTWTEFFETNFAENGGIAHVREWLLVLGTRK